MLLTGIALFAQLTVAARSSLPVLSFPEPGLDDSASYQGYQTRFYRDNAGNTVQIYLDQRSGRVVHLWADAEDESLAFSVRDASGRLARIDWDGAEASVSGDRRWRTLEYRLRADAPRVTVGWPLLGSMRVERDFQYAGRHRLAFGAGQKTLPEVDRLLQGLARLESVERRRHLALLNASSLGELRSRLLPKVTVRQAGTDMIARIVQSALDGRDTLALELRTDARKVALLRTGDSLSFRARAGTSVPMVVRISTQGRALTPLTRGEIFTPEFLGFLARETASGASVRGRLLEREARGVELLASREKLMAGLPAYATYFGRDMLMSALMMQPIWRHEMSAFVVASALRKLSPRGDVSHEEALGGQAIRESASEYATLVSAALRAQRTGDRAAADSLLGRARIALGNIRRVRENYHMIDDEFHLPILAARWLTDPQVATADKRAFLLDSTDAGRPRVQLLLREFGLVARMTQAYASDPIATNLVSFPARDSVSWSSASWRDSGAGYAGGRFAMDVNAIWAPRALQAIQSVLDVLPTLGISVDSLARVVPELAPSTPLGRYATDREAFGRATATWWGAARHFLVSLAPTEVRSRVDRRLNAMPETDRQFWQKSLGESNADKDSLQFLALSLGTDGQPIGVANSDPATRLFLGDEPGVARATAEADVLRDARLFVRAYPVGLLVQGVGPVVANDAYASSAIWPVFEQDRYHGPRVVWGREVNLFLLGAANHIAAAGAGSSAYVDELRSAIATVQSAVQASGFRSELWSYEIRNGAVVPIRYGTGSDVQLWSTTDLAVQFALSKLAPH